MSKHQKPSWRAQVRYLTRKRWEGPFVVEVEGTTLSSVAARAITYTRTRLKPRARITEVTLTLRRQITLPPA